MKTDYVFGDRVKVLPKIDEATEYSDRVKDGDIGVAYFDSCGAESFYSAEYSKGTLQEYVDNLGRGRG